MGNKQSQPSDWIDDFANERKEIIWGNGNVEKQAYPSFWPPAWQSPSQSRGDVEFGRVYQFPVISPFLLHDDRFMTIFPPIDFSKVNSPNVKVMQLFAHLDAISTAWKDSIQEKSIARIISNAFYFFQQYDQDINSYLNENVPDCLNYFGLVDYKSGQKYFEKKLPYIPNHFLITTTLFILLRLQLHFKNDNAPFLEWKRLSSVIVKDNMPSSKEFLDAIPHITAQYGNFWIEMNNFLKTPIDVHNFLAKNKQIMDEMLHLRAAKKRGELTLGGDTYSDNYSVRIGFLRILKYNVNGNRFNFPLFTDFPVNGAYCNVSEVNHYCILYLELMYENLNKILPDIWDSPLGVIHPVLPIGEIKPIDDTYLQKNFQWFKQEWAMTAEYAFFNRNRAPWPPFVPESDRKAFPEGSANQLIFDFIMTYPPPRLKVPPFSFTEWQRKTEGWHRVFEEQWNSYFTWVRHNAFAQNQLNWVPPGEQMKNAEGELLFYKDDRGQDQPLLNTFPDFGIMDLDQNYGKGIKYLLPWVAGAEWIWGDNFWDFVNGAVRKLFKLVIDALIALYNLVGGLFPFILLGLGLLGGYLVFGRSEGYPTNQQT